MQVQFLWKLDPVQVIIFILLTIVLGSFLRAILLSILSRRSMDEMPCPRCGNKTLYQTWFSGTVKCKYVHTSGLLIGRRCKYTLDTGQ